jgi:hypothetical protein
MAVGRVQWGSGSDQRIKKNIKPVKRNLVRKIFGLLNPVQFNYNNKVNTNHENMHYGLIAQEVEGLFGGLGIKNDIVEEMDNGYLYVNYHKFHGFELAAIKDLYEKSDEQQTEIDDLKNTVSRQQAEIDELKQQVKYLMEKVGV